MKIKIHDTVKSSLTSDEYKYLLLLQASDKFADGVKKVREELKISVLSDNETLDPQNDIPDGKSLNDKSWELVQELKIPFSLHGCVESIIQWGQVLLAVVPFIVLNVEHSVNRKGLYSDKIRPRPFQPALHPMLLDSWYKNNQQVLIDAGSVAPAYPLLQIGKKMTKTQLKKYIDEKWPDIEAAMDDYEKSLPVPAAIRSIKTKDVELDLKIFEFRKKGLTHAQIKKELEKDQVFLEEEAIRGRYSDFNKLLQDLDFIPKV